MWEAETNNDFAKMLQLELIKKDKDIYILQQENERLRCYKDLYKDLLNQSESNIKQLIKILHKYKSRCKKSIKLLNKRKEEQDNGIGWVEMRTKEYFEEIDELINILNGSDEK